MQKRGTELLIENVVRQAAHDKWPFVTVAL
jgi:hypothetical protein